MKPQLSFCACFIYEFLEGDAQAFSPGSRIAAATAATTWGGTVAGADLGAGAGAAASAGADESPPAHNLQVWSWGWNDRGTLGLGHRGKSRKPMRLATLQGTRIVQVGCCTSL